jgi:hypothetical protein
MMARDKRHVLEMAECDQRQYFVLVLGAAGGR